jgi:nucleoid-associated protein YgaU
MDNSHSKGGNTDKRPEPVKPAPAKMPKNVRQVGSISARNKVIYVEDYVMTYIKQLSDKEHSGCKIAVLLGYYVRNEEGKNIFIKGAVEMVDTDYSNGIILSDESWTSIYENIKKYFSNIEIVGWSLIGPEFFIESVDKIRKIHMDNFQGPDKVFLKMDSMEKDEAFYLNENNQLVKQTGYYIYYEKNEEMQNYMVENKEIPSEEKNYSDHTTRKIRNVIQEKKEVKDDRSVIRLLYAASTLLAIIVLVIAATMLDNYDKMKSMETALNTISKNLNLSGNSELTGTAEEDLDKGEVKAAGSTSDDNQVADNTQDSKTVEDAQSAEDTVNNDNNSADSNEESTKVETVKGNIDSNEEDGNTPAGTKETKTSDDNSGKKDTDKKSTDKKDTGNKTDTAKADDKKGSNSEKDSEGSVPASAKVKYYIVRSGDSLAAISFELYHTFSYMDEIKELNGIEDENKIYEGQKLIVP